MVPELFSRVTLCVIIMLRDPQRLAGSHFWQLINSPTAILLHDYKLIMKT